MLFWCRIITDDILMKSLLIVTGGPYIDLMYESMTFILVDLFKVTFVNPFKFQRHSRQSNIVLTIKNSFWYFIVFIMKISHLLPLVLRQHQLPLHFTIQFRKIVSSIFPTNIYRLLLLSIAYCMCCVKPSSSAVKTNKNVLIASWMASDKFSWKIIKRCKLLFVCLYCHKCNCSLFFRVSTNELLTASRNTQKSNKIQKKMNDWHVILILLDSKALFFCWK